MVVPGFKLSNLVQRIDGIPRRLRGAEHDATAIAAGILLQAMVDTLTPQKKSQKDWRLWERDAEDWFDSDDEYVGSFQWVCDILAIKPAELRKRIGNARKWGWTRRRALVRSLARHVRHTDS